VRGGLGRVSGGLVTLGVGTGFLRPCFPGTEARLEGTSRTLSRSPALAERAEAKKRAGFCGLPHLKDRDVGHPHSLSIQTWVTRPEDGEYIRANDGKKPHSGFNVQEFLTRRAEGKAELEAIPKSAKVAAEKPADLTTASA